MLLRQCGMGARRIKYLNPAPAPLWRSHQCCFLLLFLQVLLLSQQHSVWFMWWRARALERCATLIGPEHT